MKTEYYSPEDFDQTHKYDAHIHVHTFNDVFVRKAKNANLRLLSINTDFDYLPIDAQLKISQFLHQHYPETFNFLCTFDTANFASKTFVEDSIEQIKNGMAAGAKGVKIWKNIGMTLRNDTDNYIMVNDPVFAPIFAFLEKEKIPVLAHLGEPRNCWLPVERMITEIDRLYFSEHPNFHMYLHPEAPSYEQQIEARDHILERYPDLIFIGAHLGSMEWSFEEVAKRLDKFPNFYVDLSVKFEYIYEQAIRNRNRVIDFFETYQNRILYGSDSFLFPYDRRKWMKYFCRWFPRIYKDLLFRKSYRIIENHWLFLATDKIFETGIITDDPEYPKHIEGLKLSKDVVNRIFYENAQRFFYY